MGEKGEEFACDFLMKQGYTIIERNVANKYGEIDIVAKKGTTVHFFEVKAGKQGSWFNPADNLTRAKLHKLVISAEYYALIHHIKEYRVQGVIVMIGSGEKGGVEIMELF